MAETAAMEKIRESIQSFEEEYPGFRLDAADIQGGFPGGRERTMRVCPPKPEKAFD